MLRRRRASCTHSPRLGMLPPWPSAPVRPWPVRLPRPRLRPLPPQLARLPPLRRLGPGDRHRPRGSAPEPGWGGHVHKGGSEHSRVHERGGWPPVPPLKQQATMHRPTSRASALVMCRSLPARAATRAASSVGVTPGAEVRRAVYESAKPSTLSATRNSHRSASGWHSSATCSALQCVGGARLRFRQRRQRKAGKSKHACPRQMQAPSIKQHRAPTDLFGLGVSCKELPNLGVVSPHRRHLLLGDAPQEGEQGGHVVSHALLQERVRQPAWPVEAGQGVRMA